MKRKKTVLISLGILLVAVVITFVIFNTEPTAQSEAATKKTAMLVDVVEVERGNFTPVFQATGTVQPVEDLMLSAQVGGQVIRRSPAFTPGGFVEKGTLLLQIDPSDYRNTVALRKSELSRAQTDLAMEMGRQEVAEQDLALAGVDSLSEQQRSLVLRQPQLKASEAQIQGARAAVEQAELNLSRTSIRAPFDAHILSQNVTLGDQISPGDDLGRLVGTDYYWVWLSLPVSNLRWLQFPKQTGEKGAAVRLRNTTAWPEGVYRQGHLHEQIGALDEETRLARVLVRVPDPLNYEVNNEAQPDLMIGTFVQAQVQGKEIEGVIRLNRDFLRSNNTVWVMEDEKLSIRDVEVVLTDVSHAYISKGLKEGDKVVTTNLSMVAEGIDLRTRSADSLSQRAQEIKTNPED